MGWLEDWMDEDEFNRDMRPPASEANRPGDQDYSWRDGPPGGVGTGAGTGNDGASADDSVWGNLLGDVWKSFNKKGQDRSQKENFLWTAGTALAGWAGDKFAPSESKRIADESLARMEQHTLELERQKRGAFTPEERRDIEDASEPTVNRVAQGVGARGLASSGAGAQIVAEAQQKPFFDAMGNARRAFSQENVKLWQYSTQMAASDPGFGQLLGDWAADYFYLRNEGVNDQTMQMLAEWMKEANEIYAKITDMIQKGEDTPSGKEDGSEGIPSYSNRSPFDTEGSAAIGTTAPVKSVTKPPVAVTKPVIGESDLDVSAAPGVVRKPIVSDREAAIKQPEITLESEEITRDIAGIDPIPGTYGSAEMLEIIKGLENRMKELQDGKLDKPKPGDSDLGVDPKTGEKRSPIAGDRQASSIIMPTDNLTGMDQPKREPIDAIDEMAEIHTALSSAYDWLKAFAKNKQQKEDAAKKYDKTQPGLAKRLPQGTLKPIMLPKTPSIGAVAPPQPEPDDPGETELKEHVPGTESTPGETVSPVDEISLDYKTKSPVLATAKELIGLSENGDGWQEDKGSGGLQTRIATFLNDNGVKYLGKPVDPSKTPWCAAFVWAVLNKNGYDYLTSLRAKDWSLYGTASKGKEGDIGVWVDPKTGKGHTGFLVIADGKHKILGGNIGNKVSLTSKEWLDGQMKFQGYRTPVKAARA